MPGRFTGKVAVVTGGSSGIGLATARRFAAEGASVYIVGRRPELLDEAAARIRAEVTAGTGGDVTAVRGDVAVAADLDRLYVRVAADRGRVDVVFANAAVIDVQPLGQITEAAIDRMLGVNVKGVVLTVQGALPLLAEGGAVVLTSSIGAHKGIPGQSVYTASKAPLRTLARAWAVELKPRAVRVNVVTAGVFDTEGAAALLPDPAARAARDERFATIPAGRIGDPAELAEAVLFLASPAASYITGADLHVDGGVGQV